MHIWDDKFGHQTFRYKKYAYVKNRAGTFISLYGDRLKRITGWEKDQPELFESDVNPEIRVLVDNYTDSDDVSEGHRTMIFDIEVEVTDGFPDVIAIAGAGADVSASENAIVTKSVTWSHVTPTAPGLLTTGAVAEKKMLEIQPFLRVSFMMK